jgi:predicted Zn-dependent peptidase
MSETTPEAPESPSAVNGAVDPEEVGKKVAKKRGKETPAEPPPETPAEPAPTPAKDVFTEFWGL